MPPKKRKAAQTEDISSKRAKVQNLAPSEWGSAEDKTNTEKGFPVIPIELTTEILAYFPKIERSTRLIYGDEPVLGWEYLERKDILRALSQTCIAYRSIFLPLLWESFDVCCQSRSMDRPAFYRHAGETLQRKSEGLLNNPHLASYIRIVNVIFTRFKTERVLPPFVECVKIMPNLHTFHILHAHTKMTTALKVAFNDVTLSSILYVNLPGYAHEFLKCCANVKDVECVRDDGSKLVTMIAKNCHSVEKIAGFLPDDKLMKRIVKAMPNLQSVQIGLTANEAIFSLLATLKHLNRIEIRHPVSSDVSEQTIQLAKAVLLKSESKITKRLQVCHEELKVTLSGIWQSPERKWVVTYTNIEVHT